MVLGNTANIESDYLSTNTMGRVLPNLLCVCVCGCGISQFPNQGLNQSHEKAWNPNE